MKQSTLISLFRLTAGALLAAVVMGSVVCATQSGFECGRWPGCSDSSLLPTRPVGQWLYKNPWIEMVHRTTAILAGPLALVSALAVVRRRDLSLRVKVLPWVAVAAALVSGSVGRLVVLGAPVPPWLGTLDLASALIALTVMVFATVELETGSAHFAPGRTGTIALAALGTLVTLHLASPYAAGAGSFTRCVSWPLWAVVAGDDPTMSTVRAILAGAAAGLIAGASVLAWRTRELIRPAGVVAGLLASVLVLGPVIAYAPASVLAPVFSILSAGLLAALGLLAARASLRGSRSTEPSRPTPSVALRA